MTPAQALYDLDKFKTLVDKFRALDFTDEELTLFDVGTRGHFENPTTELLSFFLDSTKPHDLEDSFLTVYSQSLRKRTYCPTWALLKV